MVGFVVVALHGKIRRVSKRDREMGERIESLDLVTTDSLLEQVERKTWNHLRSPRNTNFPIRNPRSFGETQVQELNFLVPLYFSLLRTFRLPFVSYLRSVISPVDSRWRWGPRRGQRETRHLDFSEGLVFHQCELTSLVLPREPRRLSRVKMLWKIFVE